MTTTVFLDARSTWIQSIEIHGRPRVDTDAKGDVTNPNQPNGHPKVAAAKIYEWLAQNVTPQAMLELQAQFASFTVDIPEDRGGGQ